MKLLVAVAVAVTVSLAGAADARRPYRPPPPPPPPSDVGAEVAAAIRAKDGKRLLALIAPQVQILGQWTPDPGCAPRYRRPRVEDQRAMLAHCLAQLKLVATTRKPGAFHRAILTAEPGYEIELGTANGQLRWIAPVTRTEAPALTLQAFEALRKTGSINVDAEVRAALGPAGLGARTSISVWHRICLDDKGAIAKVEPVPTADATDPARGAFVAAIRTWTFRPFQAGATAIPACAMTLMTYPAGRAPLVETLPAVDAPPVDLVTVVRVDKRDPMSFDGDVIEGEEGGVESGVAGGVVGGPPPPPSPPPPPPPPPPPLLPSTVPPTLIESLRISGSKTIDPDAVHQSEMRRAGVDKVVGTYKVCVGTSGAVYLVSQLKSTGNPGYDRKLLSTIRGWTFRPYLVNSKPTAVCTAYTFIYAVKPGGSGTP